MLPLPLQVVDQSRVRIKAENLRRIRNKIGKSINVVIDDAAIAVIDHVFNTTDVDTAKRGDLLNLSDCAEWRLACLHFQARIGCTTC